MSPSSGTRSDPTEVEQRKRSVSATELGRRKKQSTPGMLPEVTYVPVSSKSARPTLLSSLLGLPSSPTTMKLIVGALSSEFRDSGPTIRTPGSHLLSISVFHRPVDVV